MSWFEDLKDVYKQNILLSSKVEDASKSVDKLTDCLDSNISKLSNKLEDHGERLARLEGGFQTAMTLTNNQSNGGPPELPNK